MWRGACPPWMWRRLELWRYGRGISPHPQRSVNVKKQICTYQQAAKWCFGATRVGFELAGTLVAAPVIFLVQQPCCFCISWSTLGLAGWAVHPETARAKASPSASSGLASRSKTPKPDTVGVTVSAPSSTVHRSILSLSPPTARLRVSLVCRRAHHGRCQVPLVAYLFVAARTTHCESWNPPRQYQWRHIKTTAIRASRPLPSPTLRGAMNCT